MKKEGFQRCLRWLIRILVLLLAVLLALRLSGVVRRDRPSRRGIQIRDTKTLVTHIRAMSSLVTACYYDEVVLTARKQRSVNAFGARVPLPEDEICIISHGKAQAGIDLSKLSDDAFEIRGDTVMVRLPEPELFEVILNPSDYEIFVEEGKWSHDEVVSVEKRAKEAIARDARAAGLTEKASESAGRQLDRLLRAFGFREVVLVPHSLPLPSGEKAAVKPNQ
ncbi:MAG: DUF4230 domain-containing protein [Bacteroidales bacterium]|nr:DUF4230 domain-containing protein [Bacteroidales bacterium]